VSAPVTSGPARAASPSAAALRAAFGAAILKTQVSCGDTIVTVDRAWLRDTPAQEFNYLTDITAVDYRDPERDLEVVYQLRSLGRRADLRLKVSLRKADPLEVDSVVDLWKGANWLEREVFDMFGVTFKGHPDLRRILMWDTYAEGHPLRKDFPLRGHFTRSEQTRQALAANPEAHYSIEELSIAEAYDELPEEMRHRLSQGKRGHVT
jgi:NADH-quinone oxidoreductase subunit C